MRPLRTSLVAGMTAIALAAPAAPAAEHPAIPGSSCGMFTGSSTLSSDPALFFANPVAALIGALLAPFLQYGLDTRPPEDRCK